MGSVVEFPMLELKSAWKEAASRLKLAGISMPLLDSRLLLQHAVEITYEELLAHPRRKLKQHEVEAYAKLIARRLNHEPVSVILGKKAFWKHIFKTSRDTLDPRPDTESLVDLAVRQLPKNQPLHLLELGVGTGAVLLSVLHDLPLATGVGVDISEAALKIAQENATDLGLNARVTLVESNWFGAVEGRFDLILSNPPYIPTDVIPTLEPEVRDYDPLLALDGGEDGLSAYRIIAQNLPDFLAEEGKLMLEIGQNQADAVEAIFHQRGFGVVLREKDLGGITRCLLLIKMK